ncbi:unnamed protein product [Lathyrus oleraceus]
MGTLTTLLLLIKTCLGILKCNVPKKRNKKIKTKVVLESWNLPKDNPEPGESSTTTQLFPSRTTGQQH